MTHYLLNNYLKYDKSNSTFTYLISKVMGSLITPLALSTSYVARCLITIYYSLSNDEENANDAPVAIDKHEIVDVPKIAVDEYAVVADYGTAANLPETNVDAFASPTKSPLRRTKTRSIEVPSPKRSSMNRCERSSDSMLEDALVADKLKRRLASRRLSQVTNRRTIEYTGLSDFIVSWRGAHLMQYLRSCQRTRVYPMWPTQRIMHVCRDTSQISKMKPSSRR